MNSPFSNLQTLSFDLYVGEADGEKAKVLCLSLGFCSVKMAVLFFFFSLSYLGQKNSRSLHYFRRM